MNLTMIASFIAAAIGFGAAWTYQGKQLAELELTHANERIINQAAARRAIERSTSAVIKAQNGAVVLAGKSRADADSARTELDGLRVATETALRSASASLDACLVAATTATKLLNQCGAEYQALGERADRHTNDIKTLTAAWPK